MDTSVAAVGGGVRMFGWQIYIRINRFNIRKYILTNLEDSNNKKQNDEASCFPILKLEIIENIFVFQHLSLTSWKSIVFSQCYILRSMKNIVFFQHLSLKPLKNIVFFNI